MTRGGAPRGNGCHGNGGRRNGGVRQIHVHLDGEAVRDAGPSLRDRGDRARKKWG